MVTVFPTPSVPTVTFWGAAQTVTGSMHLVETPRRKILLDCGLYRGSHQEARKRNGHFPFHPQQIDAVILSHAHIDHCGNLPNLVRQGFRGPLYCTLPTRDLISVMLADSARIQEDDARHAADIGLTDESSHPLYTRGDVQRTLDQCEPLAFGESREIQDGMAFHFVDAGHLLGSAMTHLGVQGTQSDWSLTFTGDLGRRGLPFVPEPAPTPSADLLICESTYGGAVHKTVEEMSLIMADAVHRTVARGGKVLIPAFSLGRTQVVVYYLRKWMAEGLLPRLPLFVDSPLAELISEVHRRHSGYLDARAARAIMSNGEGQDAPVARYLHSHEDSHRISVHPEPCIIVASGGMCEGGRIVRHLKLHLDDPRSSLVLVSYQAPGSLGRKLMDKKPTVRFLGRNWNKWIEVVELNGFSGHADRDDFMAYLKPLEGSVKKVRLVHGEKEAGAALAKSLKEVGFEDVVVPLPGDSVKVS